MKNVCLIPARIGSSRFPKKPLAMIAGVPMIVRVLETASQVFGLDSTFVVTDSDEISEVAEKAGFQAIIVRDEVATGTDRIALASRKIPLADRYFNLQGDEPLIDQRDLESFRQQSVDSDAPVTNSYLEKVDLDRAKSSNSIKMVMSKEQKLLFASRSKIPFDSGLTGVHPLSFQVCMYSFTYEALEWFLASERGPVETSENVEILRFVEHGREVKLFQSFFESHPVDVPSDIQIVERILEESEHESR